jgi:hypothetical protein
MGADGRVVVHYSRWKLVLFLGLSLVFVAVGLLALIFDSEARGSWWAYASVAGFGAAFVVFARRLIRRTPAVVVDANGVGGHGCPYLRWNEIEDLHEYSVSTRGHTQRYLAITPGALVDVQSRRHPLLNLLGPLNRSFCGTDVNLSLNSLDRSHEEVLDLVERFSGRRVRREGD